MCARAGEGGLLANPLRQPRAQGHWVAAERPLHHPRPCGTCAYPSSTRPPPQDHDVFARHNKFGTFQVPKTFLNFNEEAEQCALKVAEKGAAKKATKQAVATQTNQKTVLTKTDRAQTDQKANKNKAVADEAPTVAEQVFPAKSPKEEGAACEQPGRPCCHSVPPTAPAVWA